MRMRLSYIIISLVAWLVSCDTEADKAFEDHYIKYFGGDGDQQAADFVLNDDGTMLILGTSEFNETRRIYLIKIDEDGMILWEKYLGESAENAKDIEPIIGGTHAGGYLILSNPVIDEEGNTAIKVIRIDVDGNEIDSLKIDNQFLPSNYASSVTPTLNGGFFVAGNTTDITQTPGDNAQIYVDQTDLLILLFDEAYVRDDALLGIGGEPDVMGIKIFGQGVNEYNFAGYSNTRVGSEVNDLANYDYNFWFYKKVPTDTKQDFSGDPLTQEKLNAITRTPIGDYFAVGTVVGASQQIFVSRIINEFSLGDATITSQPIGKDGSEGIAVAPAGGTDILVLGNEATSGGTRDIWLTKLDRNLDQKDGFPRVFGSPGNDDTASAVTELPNGDIVILGTINLENQNKIALIKLKADGGF